MVYLYLSEMCEQGKCELCDGGTKALPMTFGGSKCTCSCHRIKKEKKGRRKNEGDI